MREKSISSTPFVYLSVAVTALSVLLYGVFQVVSTAQPVEAWTANNYNWAVEANSGDRFANYDGGNPGLYTNVDWPIRFLFTNGAHVNHIKNRLDGKGGDPWLEPQLGQQGFGILLKLQDTGTDYHDEDAGIKRGLSCPPNHESMWDDHMRIYAANPDGTGVDFGWNNTWGHWVVASVHRDKEYLGLGNWCSNLFFSREADETWFNQRILNMNSLLLAADRWTPIYTNSYNWQNPELLWPPYAPCTVEANVPGTGRQADPSHCVESKGWNTVANVAPPVPPPPSPW